MLPMSECMKPHALLHSLSGFGVGLILAGIIPGLTGQTAWVIGLILLIIAIIGEFSLKPTPAMKQMKK